MGYQFNSQRNILILKCRGIVVRGGVKLKFEMLSNSWSMTEAIGATIISSDQIMNSSQLHISLITLELRASSGNLTCLLLINGTC